MAADFDLALAVTADGTSAVAAANQLDGALDRIDAAERRAAGGAQELEKATEGAATAQGQLGTTAGATASRLQQNTKAQNDNAAAANRQSYAVRNLGQQVGDFALQVQLGQGVARAFASQIGQVGFALSEMEGKAGRVGAFLVGPWGIALTIGLSVLAPFVEKLFQSGDAAKDAEAKTYDFSKGLDVLTLSAKESTNAMAQLVAETRNAIKVQGDFLRQKALVANASVADLESRLGTNRTRLGQLNRASQTPGGLPNLNFNRLLGIDPIANEQAALRAKIAADEAALAGAKQAAVNAEIATSQTSVLESLDASTAATGRYTRAVGELNRRVRQSRNDPVGAQADGTFISEDQAKLVFKRLTTLKDQRIKAAQEAEKAESKAASEAKKREREREAAAKKAQREAIALGKFGEGAAEQIQRITEQFDAQPTAIDRANQATRTLDKTIAELSKRKPANFADLIAQAQRAKGLIEDSLDKPYRDFIESQRQSLEVQRLITAGRTDEAEALRIIQGLERTGKEITEERKQAILDTVQALREEQREADILREKQEKYLTAIGDIKSAVKGVLTDGLDGIADVPKRLIGAFTRLRTDEIFENLFGDVFRELEDQVRGTNTVRNASERMARAVETTINPLDRLADAAGKAATSLGGSTSGGQIAGVGGLVSAGTNLFSNIPGGIAAALKTIPGLSFPGAASNDNEGGDIVVTGRRRQRDSAQDLFTRSIEKIAKGVGISDEGAAKIGKIGGKAIAGAATGAAVNSVLAPLGKALGVRTSQTGAQIGGAIGSFIPIPGGQIIGSVLGSVVGGLFKGNRTANAVLTGADAISIGGKDRGNYGTASGLGGSVLDGLKSVADQLGAELGNFYTTIGVRGGDYRVNTTGSSLKTKNGAKNFGDDEAAAIAYAIADAIADGAIKGISPAVEKALKSSTDVDKALAEAVKVQSLENDIKYLGNDIQKAFDEFAKTAADRVSLARKYGVDLLKVEELNAKERQQLLDDALKSQVGSLQSLLTDLNSGNLFEGTGAEKRSAILSEIGTVQARAAAGEAGAADELAQLYRNLLEVSRDAYGTAGGEYASDRSTVQSGAAAIIKAEQDRINAANATTQATLDAANQNNVLTNETNDLLAQQTAAINAQTVTIADIFARARAATGTAYTARSAA